MLGGATLAGSNNQADDVRGGGALPGQGKSYEQATASGASNPRPKIQDRRPKTTMKTKKTTTTKTTKTTKTTETTTTTKTTATTKTRPRTENQEAMHAGTFCGQLPMHWKH